MADEMKNGREIVKMGIDSVAKNDLETGKKTTAECFHELSDARHELFLSVAHALHLDAMCQFLAEIMQKCDQWLEK